MSGTLLALILSAQIYSEIPQFQRLSFNLPIAAEQGGGTAIGLAGQMEYLRPDFIVASGGVDVRYGAQRIRAQRLEMDLNNETVLAEGDVILDEGPQRLAGERLEYDLGTRTGTVYDAKATLAKDLYFYGAEMSKVGPDVYTVRDGVLTSCDSEDPAWSFRLSRARIVMEGFAKIYNTRMRVKKLPFLYTPFIMVPAKSERTSGLLTPNLGYSERRGGVVGLAWFQTFGDSYDATAFFDHYTEGIEAFGTEFRYAPLTGTAGYLVADFVDDKNNIFGNPEDEGELRWRVNWRHRSSELPLGLTAVVNHTDFSDFNFFRDFSRNFDSIRISRIQSSAFLQGSWGKHSGSLLLENQEQFINAGLTRSRRQLPELEYRLRATQIAGLPLYFNMAAGAHSFEIKSTDSPSISYQRVNLNPRLSVPLGVSWLSATVNIDARAATYSDSLSAELNDSGNREFTGESITQTVGSASANIIGPSFSRVFHKGVGQWGKFKHVIEPRWDYFSSADVDDRELIPQFDQIDSTRQATELATFRLVNRLLAKPEDEDSPFGAREIMSFELSQSFSFKDEQPLTRLTVPDMDGDGSPELLTKQESPISLQYRYRPSQTTNIDLSGTYNTLFNQFNRAAISGAKQFGSWRFSLNYSAVFDPQTGETTGSQARFGSVLGFFRQRLLIASQVNYDLELSLLQQQSHVIAFNTQCWSLRMDLREYKSLAREDRDIRFSISLKNIGTFLDLNDSTRQNDRF